MRNRSKTSSKHKTKKYSIETESVGFNVGKILGQAIPQINAKFNRPKEFIFGTIQCPFDIADFIREQYSRSSQLQETFTVLCLDGENNISGYYTIRSLSESNEDLTTILSCALFSGSTSIVIAHNKPDGALEASEADTKLNSRIKGIARHLNIILMDHIIVTKAGYFSFAACGNL